MTKKVETGNTIKVSYTWKLVDWTVFDSTEKHGGEPLEFTVWARQMIVWFDEWVVGMKLWETKIIEIQAEKAYWEKDDSKKQVIPKKDLASFKAAWFELKTWEKLPTQYWEFEICDDCKETITLDTNHSLAWKDLTFEVKIEEIK